MNRTRTHDCDHVSCHSQQRQESIQDQKRTTPHRTVYQVDARTICELSKENDNKCTYRSFGQLLYLASIDRLTRASYYQNDTSLSTNTPDLISIAIHWNSSQCTTSDVEDFVSIVEPFIYLRELFYDVIISDKHAKQLTLIGLICFYGSTIEVFFSYDHSKAQWLFCFDGHITIVTNWNAVIRKCIDFHLQPFLLIYANSQWNPVDISQLLKRTVIETKIKPYDKIFPPANYSMPKHESYPSKKHELYSIDDLSKISSFATLNSSMLFMPKSTNNSTYISQETVAKVMQQQLLKKDALSDTGSSASSQRDSGLGSAAEDPDERNQWNMSIISIEQHLEQSLRHENSSNYSLALESCQRAMSLIDQILNQNLSFNTHLSIYARTRKNSLLLRIRSLRKREQNEQLVVPMLRSITRLSRPKKNVKFSDNVALIVPTIENINEPPSEHLIHSFLRKIHYPQQSTSDSDSDTPSSPLSSSSSSAEIPIGLSECSLCYKRFSKTNQSGSYCSNCHFYMKRFQPGKSSR